MRLRTAKKIWSALDTLREWVYSAAQKDRACARVLRTRTSREAGMRIRHLLLQAGAGYRAEMLARAGAPDLGFRLLMETEDEWSPRRETS